MSIPYVKFFPSDWKAGCANLSPIEELVYLKICLENWDTGNPMTSANLTRAMRGHSEGIADALQYLIDEQKIEKNDEGFFNKRAINIHKEAVKRHKDASKAASKRWKNKGKSDNAPALKPHKPSICQPEPEPEPYKEEDTNVSPKKNNDLEDAVNAFNIFAKHCGIPIPKKITEARKSKLKQRLIDAGGLDEWKSILTKCSKSDHLMGKTSGWKMDFDFILSEGNFCKIVEGRYNNRTNAKQGGYIESVQRTLNQAAEEDRLRFGDSAPSDLNEYNPFDGDEL